MICSLVCLLPFIVWSSIGPDSNPSRINSRGQGQTASMLDRFISGVGQASDAFDRQAAEVRDRSLLIAKETLTNSMEFAQRVTHVKQPQELFQLQSEFFRKQAQTLADHSRHFGQSIAQGVQQIGKVASEGLREASRTTSEAA